LDSQEEEAERNRQKAEEVGKSKQVKEKPAAGDDADASGKNLPSQDDKPRFEPRDILNTSSGTLARLYGETNYDKIDEISGKFHEAVSSSGKEFDNIADAWEWYKEHSDGQRQESRRRRYQEAPRQH
jgi:hypothetical protein